MEASMEITSLHFCDLTPIQILNLKNRKLIPLEIAIRYLHSSLHSEDSSPEKLLHYSGLLIYLRAVLILQQKSIIRPWQLTVSLNCLLCYLDFSFLFSKNNFTSRPSACSSMSSNFQQLQDSTVIVIIASAVNIHLIFYKIKRTNHKNKF